MAHDHDHPVDRVPSDLLQQMGYETRDVTPAAILRWISVLFVFIAIVSFGILGLENYFVPETGRVAYDSEIYRASPVHHMPAQPQLQVEPKRDMIMYRRDEKRVLDGYSTTDKGNVAIPVDQAIDQMADEGISGVKAGTPKPKVDAYPGSGVFDTTAPAEKAETVVAPSATTPSEVDSPAPTASPEAGTVHTP